MSLCGQFSILESHKEIFDWFTYSDDLNGFTRYIYRIDQVLRSPGWIDNNPAAFVGSFNVSERILSLYPW